MRNPIIFPGLEIAIPKLNLQLGALFAHRGDISFVITFKKGHGK
jgi:hypothetical protein